MKKVWRFEVEQHPHTTILEVNWTTRRQIWLDGEKIVDDTPVHNMGSEYQFICEGHPCTVKIGRSYLILRTEYTLTVNGRIIEGKAM